MFFPCEQERLGVVQIPKGAPRLSTFANKPHSLSPASAFLDEVTRSRLFDEHLILSEYSTRKRLLGSDILGLVEQQLTILS